jgi:hypothetical protein
MEQRYPGYRERQKVRAFKNSLLVQGLKRCRTCHKDLPATHEYFRLSETCIDGFRSDCRACQSADYKLYNQRTGQGHRYYVAHRQHRQLQGKLYHANNRAKILERKRSRYHMHRASKLTRILFKSNPTFSYFHGYCAVCNQRLSENAKPIIWTQREPNLLVPLCSRCISDKGSREPKEWLKHCYAANRAAEILRVIGDYFIWLKDEVVNA